MNRSAPRTTTAPPPDCWRLIGVSGDRSCPELEQFIHCRNCPVLAEAARGFFDRPAPDGYLESWGEVLDQPERAAESAATSMLVFRIGVEWLALPASVLVETAPQRRLHHLPHVKGGILEGIVNIRGQLQLCVSLGRLLGLDAQPTPADAGRNSRLLVVDREGDRWVFGVDEVAGVHRVPTAALRPVPATVSAASLPLTAALCDVNDRTVGVLDESRLFRALRERLVD